MQRCSVQGLFSGEGLAKTNAAHASTVHLVLLVRDDRPCHNTRFVRVGTICQYQCCGNTAANMEKHFFVICFSVLCCR